jgi:hypothetical protein
MKLVRRARLHLEHLEDRTCPTLAITYRAGALTLTGSPLGRLDLTASAGNTIQVTDNAGAINYGTFANTSSVRLQLRTHPGIINFDLNGTTFGGSVYMDLGLGDPNIAGTHPVNIFGGTLTGPLTVLNGNGVENISLGLTANPVTITSNVIVNGSSGPGGGDTLFVVDGSTVSGNLTTTKIDNVDIGDGTGATVGTVAGNVSVDDSSAPVALNVNVLGVVGGNLSVRGGAAGTIVAVVVSHPGGGVVGGSLSADLGTSPGPTLAKYTQAANTTIGSNLTVTGGAGGATVSVAGRVGGSATFNLGTGTDSITLGPTVGPLAQAFVIGGAVSVTMGNGTNTFDIKGNASSSIGGSVSVTMGNGTNTFVMDGGAQVLGSTVSYRGGTVSDTVQIINGLANSFALRVTLFAGARTIELGAGITLGSMFLDFGTGGGTKTLTYDGGLVVTWPSTILNYP